jgi:hypothetical protein
MELPELRSEKSEKVFDIILTVCFVIPSVLFLITSMTCNISAETVHNCTVSAFKPIAVFAFNLLLMNFFVGLIITLPLFLICYIRSIIWKVRRYKGKVPPVSKGYKIFGIITIILSTLVPIFVLLFYK